MENGLTFTEHLHPQTFQTMRLSGPMLVDERTAFQHVQIFDTQAHGRVMALDGVVQIAERDECAYSEMLTHLPMIEHGAVKRVMIVGGGDYAIAEEALKHRGVEAVDLCDIDGRVLELCRDYFPGVHNGAVDDPRLKVHVADAFDFLRQPEHFGRYDLIVADRPDPVGPAQALFADAFYQAVALALSESGVAVFQTGVPYLQPEELTKTVGQLRRAFHQQGVYLTVTPTYVGGFMALTWGSRGARLGALGHADIAARFAAAGLRTDYYNPDIHTGAFRLPQWIKRLVE